MAWSNISKPTSTPYTNVNPQGRQTYDDSGLTYDSALAFYDSINLNQWTDVAKPAGGVVINAGMVTGLLMPLTYSFSRNAGDNWTRITKPTT